MRLPQRLHNHLHDNALREHSIWGLCKSTVSQPAPLLERVDQRRACLLGWCLPCSPMEQAAVAQYTGGGADSRELQIFLCRTGPVKAWEWVGSRVECAERPPVLR